MLVPGEDGSWSLRVEWIYDDRLGECMIRWLQVPCWMMPRLWLFHQVVMPPLLVERRLFYGFPVYRDLFLIRLKFCAWIVRKCLDVLGI